MSSSHSNTAHAWLLRMEDNLNRAAGFDGRDYSQYARIIGIAWEGDVGITNFKGSELNAGAAGRRLVPLLRQLLDAGIKVNVITHSLGARVLLTALNILGESGRQSIDHAFLWQPAIPDIAFTNDASNDQCPFGNGHFPKAHKAVRDIVVLHTERDNILGPYGVGPRWFVRLLSDLATLRVAELAGAVGGAYPKKWWRGIGQYDKVYMERLRDFGAWPAELPAPTDGAFWEEAPDWEAYPEPDWGKIEQALLAEVAAKKREYNDNPDVLPEYELLASLNHYTLVDEDQAKEYLKRLKKLWARGWSPKEGPSRAMGYGGPDLEEEFMGGMDRKGQLHIIDQKRLLMDHSGMRIPSARLFDEIYDKQIVRRLKRRAGFGRY